MTAKEFIRIIANGKVDIIQLLLDILAQTKTPYCVIGGLAVNAYAEPVVSLDLDVVVIAGQVDLICAKVREQGLKVEQFPHSINLTSAQSELRIQLQTDERYQAFIGRAVQRNLLGYEMRVAQVEDVLQGKVWAYEDETRRKSKRQKDLADIARLVEAKPELIAGLPDSIRTLVG
ncbi:MAG: hypothetical protein NTU88_06125 [Armatimonadetes bacterium]|nr:hypothetical protein [Armatimonadota bacterium]